MTQCERTKITVCHLGIVICRARTNLYSCNHALVFMVQEVTVEEGFPSPGNIRCPELLPHHDLPEGRDESRVTPLIGRVQNGGLHSILERLPVGQNSRGVYPLSTCFT